jgi:hypothetical protein
MIIIIIKIILIILSIVTIGILPLLSLLNMWIWNNVIVGHVFSCAVPIHSIWIMMGLTMVGGIGATGIIKMFKD